MRDILFVIFIVFTSLISSASANPNSANGFNLNGALVPIDEILSGGPPKDGIPAIDKPVFVKAPSAKNMRDDERVLGITRNGISKAYPINIMNYHEIVNDRFGDEAIAVTYCPLCGSGIAFKADVANKTLSFGVSGLLYNSDVLLYDRQTQSLWSQILSKAVTGPMKSNTLTTVPITHTSWADWRKQQPDTLVLSDETGFRRNYQNNPYAGYDEHEGLMFPVKFRAKGYHPKEQVFGLKIKDKAKAYPFVELAKGSGEVRDSIDGQNITVRFDKTHKSAQAFDAEGKQIAGVTLFWFAWYTFNPQTAIYRIK
ncbi:MAG: DUF3179 domain-containing protein [Methylococcaceae bacterium]|nr:DUF3179 domain-containing protein [Methylococcaceae bacterium]